MIELDSEQRMVVDSLRRIVSNEFADTAFTYEGDMPWENVATLADNGFFGINIAESYGGGGMTELEAMLVIETVGRVCPDTARYLYTQTMVAPRAIEMFGSDAAKERYLPAVTAGESMVAIAISEPEAGSDVGNMNTRVEEASDGELYIDGEKLWVSDYPESDAAVVWTKYPEGLGTAIVDLDDPGVEVNTHFTNMAGHTQTHFYMEDVHVPRENVLVRGRDAFREQLQALNWERCGSAMYTNAMAMCAFEKAVDYTKERTQFDRPIAEFQGLRWKIADMATRIELSRMQTYQTAIQAQTRGRVPDRLQSSIAKLFASEMAEEVVSESLQLHGATGYQREHPLEYLHRLVRGRRIAAGTDEIMKNNIADVVMEEGLATL
jgi:alkylation response protein AidB-like acyl-CoA dehydrogenase